MSTSTSRSFLSEKSVSTLTRTLCLALSVTLPLFLSACDNSGNKASSQPSTQPSKTTTQPTSTQPSSTQPSSTVPASAPTYTIAVEQSYPPFVSQDETGLITGFDIDLIKAIGEKSQFHVNVKVINWKTAFDGLQNSQYDMLGSGVGITPERLKLADFSTPYMSSYVVFAVTDSDINSVADLKHKTISVQPNTFYHEAIVKDFGDSNKIVEANTLFLACQQVIAGKSDACVDDINLINHLKFSLKDQKNIPVFKTFPAFQGQEKPIAFAIYKGNDELVQKVNDGMEAVMQDGTYDKLHKKWFGE